MRWGTGIKIRGLTSLRKALFAWYAREGRRLPWREDAQPYAVVVSEFMLQQTQVERVRLRFVEFVRKYPTFEMLAAAPRSEVVREWRGLGYNSRAVRLAQLAREVVASHGGTLPQGRAALLQLPGVGAYTAGAIRAFAFNLDDIAPDTNVRRVVHRLMLGVEHPPKATPEELDALAQRIQPRGRAREWNSALMDLGSSLCTARAPQCSRCPLAIYCAAAPLEPARLRVLAERHRKKKTPQQTVAFERSSRFLRGKIVDYLRALPAGRTVSLLVLNEQLPRTGVVRSMKEVTQAVRGLHRDGVAHFVRGTLRLAD